jgi:alpha-L-fucosidase
MSPKNHFLKIALTALLLPSFVYGQTTTDTSRMAWFKNAKFGIFLHWGVFSAGKGGASWPLFNGQTSTNDYIAQGKEFTAKNYDPRKWAQLFKAAGARYAVLTAMHCDGVTLWPAKDYPNTIQKLTPYKKDLLGPYVNALKEQNIKVGFYYSHVDWTSPDYMTLTQNLTNKEFNDAKKVKYEFQKNWDAKGKEGYYNKRKFNETEQATWNRFITRHDDQIGELVNNYKVDLLWFDFMYPNTGDFKWNERQFKAKLLKEHPALVVNGRIGNYGDYETPEKGLPIIAPTGPWELCETMNDNWSYVTDDHNQKSVRELLHMLVECTTNGGNLLLGIGPKTDGSIDPVQEQRLLAMGKWINNHAEAIYDTKRGILPGHFYGPTSLSLDGKTLYLFLYDDPKDEISIKGVKNRDIKQVAIVGRPDVKVKIRYSGGASWAGLPPIINIPIPKSAIDDNITVVKIEFKDVLELYRGKGKDIVNN